MSADHRGKIHGEEKAATVARLENLFVQSCRRYRVDGFIRSTYDLVSAFVRISDLAAFAPRVSVAGCDRTPERPLDCPSTDRSLRLATDARYIVRDRGCVYGDVVISGFAQWAYGTGRFRGGRHGKTDMQRS